MGGLLGVGYGGRCKKWLILSFTFFPSMVLTVNRGSLLVLPTTHLRTYGRPLAGLFHPKPSLDPGTVRGNPTGQVGVRPMVEKGFLIRRIRAACMNPTADFMIVDDGLCEVVDMPL